MYVADFLGSLCEPEQLTVFRIDHTLIYKKVDVECPVPEGAPDQHHGERPDLVTACLCYVLGSPSPVNQSGPLVETHLPHVDHSPHGLGRM